MSKVYPFGKSRIDGQIPVRRAGAPSNPTEEVWRYQPAASSFSKPPRAPLLVASSLAAVGALAGLAALQEYSERPVAQVCIDDNGKVVTDALCNDPQASTTPISQSRPYGSGLNHYPHRWYYSSRPWQIGETATDGTYSPPRGASSFRPNDPSSSGTRRGIFGGIGKAFGGGWS